MIKNILIIGLVLATIGLSGCIDTQEYIMVSFQNNMNREIIVGFNIDNGTHAGHFYLKANSDDFLPPSDYKIEKGKPHTIAVAYAFNSDTMETEFADTIEYFYNITDDVLFTIHQDGSITIYRS